MPSSRTRRAFALGALGLLGGCAGIRSSADPTTTRPDRDGDGVPDGVDDYPDDPARSFRSFHAEGMPTLHPGDFSAVALTNSPQASGDILHYEVDVQGGTPVDCLVFERDAYDAYADGARNLQVVERYSRTGVTNASVTVQLDRGEYIYSLDYTDQSTPAGSDPVEVRHVLDIADPPRTTR